LFYRRKGKAKKANGYFYFFGKSKRAHESTAHSSTVSSRAESTEIHRESTHIDRREQQHRERATQTHKGEESCESENETTLCAGAHPNKLGFIILI
jgi:hypothetical protein